MYTYFYVLTPPTNLLQVAGRSPSDFPAQFTPTPWTRVFPWAQRFFLVKLLIIIIVLLAFSSLSFRAGRPRGFAVSPGLPAASAAPPLHFFNLKSFHTSPHWGSHVHSGLRARPTASPLHVPSSTSLAFFKLNLSKPSSSFSFVTRFTSPHGSSHVRFGLGATPAASPLHLSSSSSFAFFKLSFSSSSSSFSLVSGHTSPHWVSHVRLGMRTAPAASPLYISSSISLTFFNLNCFNLSLASSSSSFSFVSCHTSPHGSSHVRFGLRAAPPTSPLHVPSSTSLAFFMLN